MELVEGYRRIQPWTWLCYCCLLASPSTWTPPRFPSLSLRRKGKEAESTCLDYFCLLMLFPCHDDGWISEDVCLVNEMIFIWGHLVTNQYKKQAFRTWNKHFNLLLEKVWSCFMSCPLLVKLDSRQPYLKMKLSNRKTCNSLKPYSESNVIFYVDFFISIKKYFHKILNWLKNLKHCLCWILTASLVRV
mgnify:CR=1 FL=1